MNGERKKMVKNDDEEQLDNECEHELKLIAYLSTEPIEEIETENNHLFFS